MVGNQTTYTVAPWIKSSGLSFRRFSLIQTSKLLMVPDNTMTYLYEETEMYTYLGNESWC